MISLSVARSAALVVAALLLPVTCSSSEAARNRPSGLARTRHGRERDQGVCELEVSCKTDDMNPVIPVRLPIRGPRGPPGQPGQRGERGEDCVPDGNTGSSGQLLRTRVAFFVGLSENMGPVSENKAVTFDRVITNVGEGYHKETGRFKAPVNGTYQFNVIISAQGRQKAAVMVVKNGAMVATVWAESIPYWASASNVAILELQPGDEVWLMLLSRASYLHGYMYTTFSGFLLFDN